MKAILTTLFLSLCMITYAQKINFGEHYDKLMEELNAENWKEAERDCNLLLNFVESVDSMETEQKVLRYIYIYSTAGLLNEKKISKEVALKKVLFLKGKEMIMPTHPFNSKCYVNCTHLAEDQPNTFFSGVNNSKGTQIFSFEYVKMKNPIEDSITMLEGKYVTLKGELSEVSVEGNMFPRFKLLFINGGYRIEE